MKYYRTSEKLKYAIGRVLHYGKALPKTGGWKGGHIQTIWKIFHSSAMSQPRKRLQALQKGCAKNQRDILFLCEDPDSVSFDSRICQKLYYDVTFAQESPVIHFVNRLRYNQGMALT